MSTLNDVAPVLQSILDKGSVLTFNEYINTVNYDVVLRTKLTEGETPPQQCDNWVAKFSAVTNSNWIVKNTSPYAVRVLYKKSYTCKNKKCNAKINIIFKKNNRNTRKNDPLLAKGLTAVIKIIFKHNHDIYCPVLGLSTDPKTNYNIAYIPSPDIKNETQIEDFSIDSQDSDSDCRETMKLINIPVDSTNCEVERFKNELQKISNIVEDEKSIEMNKYLKSLNNVLESINSATQFYNTFSKILE